MEVLFVLHSDGGKYYGDDCTDETWIELFSLLHREFRRITLMINQQTHLHKIAHLSVLTCYFM